MLKVSTIHLRAATWKEKEDYEIYRDEMEPMDYLTSIIYKYYNKI